MADRNYYVVCEDDCLFESMTKEQIIAAIAEATGNTPTGVDDAFITKIKESNADNSLTFWQGTQAEFNALGVNTAQQIIRMDANHKLYIMPGTGDDSKADKVTNATEGDIATLDANGNLVDSGKNISNIVTKINDKTGDVNLTASDVGALPSSTSYVSPTTLNSRMGRSDNINAANTNYSSVMARGIYAGTTDLTAGSSSLTSGVIYAVYE